MSFISYAQNFEDVMLWRALKHVQNGFYIDVGANDPKIDSVTKSFYDSGWCGINIEPLESHWSALQRCRERDVNLLCAAGAEAGEVEIWECEVRGWATASKSIATMHEQNGYEGRYRTVEVRRLADICAEFVSGDVHFVKIDVEGFEYSVVCGMDFSRFRPWVLVVEATKPNSTEEVHAEWECLVLAAGYSLAYCDGLNRFYVANERAELFESLRYPPNVFDDFVRIEQLESESRSKESDERAQLEASRAAQAESRAQDAELRARQADERAQLEASRAAQAESRAQDAELRARQADERAQLEASRAAQAEFRANQSDESAQLEAGRAALAESRVQSTENYVQQLELKLLSVEQAANEWHERVVQLYASTSWRLTKPLRGGKRLLANDPVLYGELKRLSYEGAKKILRPMVVGVAKMVLARPKLKAKVSHILRNRYPGLYARLRMINSVRANQEMSVIRVPGVRLVDGPYSGKKVAILVPSSGSGTVGGAERFYSGLLKALQVQGCEAELVCVKVDESTFEGIQQGYKEFSELDLSGFDLVISTKAPTYMVRHPNHILYLVHTVRVFYDMFEEVFPQADAVLKSQRDWVQAQDNAAFSSIPHRFSIGHEVSRRLVEWNGCDAEVLHPPIDVDGLFDNGVGDYFFMPGRLHPWKRVDLAIRAIKCSSLPMRLLISGAGEAESQLRELVGDDPRIEFLGRVDDEALKRLYAQSLAVPFVPVREDYGYVTLEAFASGKAVVTCTDSGEPTVFVEDGVSGFVCEPDPQEICGAFERIWNDRGLAERMGRAGRERVSYINWDTVARRLLASAFKDIAPGGFERKRLKVAVLDMQPIMPAVGGGRLRLLGLYHALGEDVEARYVGSYDWPGERYRRHAISPTLEEIDVPLSEAHHRAAAEAAAKAGGKTVIDMLFARYAHLSPEYIREAHEAVEWGDVVVFSHPWVAPLVGEELLRGKTVIYDSQNVEAELRSQLLDLSNPFEREVLDEVECAERNIGASADLVLACSKEDIEGFASRYKWQRNQMRLVPNGVFSGVIQPPEEGQKKKAREKLSIPEGVFAGFFIGSDYAPNVEAASFIVGSLARELPEILFVIGGGVCARLSGKLPANVRSVGGLDDDGKISWLHACDFAINPMFSGSGTNIKMFDFMSAGLPVVTTAVGARGIAKESSKGLLVADPAELASAVRELSSDRAGAQAGGQENRRVVEDKFAWESISPELGRAIRGAHFRKQGVALLKSPEVVSKVRVAHLSTVGLRCGIGEYTRKIIDIYRARGVSNLLLAARAANEEPCFDGIDVPYHVSWFFDNEKWCASGIQEEAVSRLLDWKATHLIVQYHPGFFSPEELFNFVSQVKKGGVSVVVVVHNFVRETAGALRRLQSLGVVLFSHSMTEVVEAREYGVLLDQTALGIDVHESLRSRTVALRDWVECPPTIVTTGFLRQHKGVPLLIRAMPKVLSVFAGAKLRIQCAIYPSDDSRLELEVCKREIERLGLQEAVVMDTRFLEKASVLNELNGADLAVLPYEDSSEGGSASATDCMAVGLPLIVSGAQIFDGIRDVALTVRSESDVVSDAIIEVLSCAELYASLSEKASSYAIANSWEGVAGVFLAAAP